MGDMVRMKYGVRESNGIESVPEHIRNADREKAVGFDDPDLLRVDRLRLISDPGYPFWDVSYAWGTMKDGTAVRVLMGDFRPRRGKGTPSVTRQLVEYCREEGVYAKGLGLLDPHVLSLLV
jgi:hypothetical protein